MNKIGIIGNPLSHTLSPNLHNSAIKHFGLDLSFEKWELEKKDLKRFFLNAKDNNVVGGCITVPHKENVLKYFDFYDNSVKRIGAANWFKIEDDRILGFNTDHIGFEKIIPESILNNLSELDCVVFGSGGSAKAVVEALSLKNAKNICIINRTFTKAKEIANKYSNLGISSLKLDSIDSVKNELNKADLIVNTTSVGMSSGPDPDGNLIKNYELKTNVTGIDLVYSPNKTPFFKKINEFGGHAINGIDMLIYQAQAGFEILTGENCPFEIMKSALKLD